MIKEETRRSRRNPRRRLANILAFRIEASENLLLIGDLGVVVINNIQLVDAVFVGEGGSGVGVLEEGVFGSERVVNAGVGRGGGGGTAVMGAVVLVGGEAAVEERH